jgi:hypothetical protein
MSTTTTERLTLTDAERETLDCDGRVWLHRPLTWRPRPEAAGLNVMFSGLRAVPLSAHRPELGWVLESVGGPFGCWNTRTEREFPPHVGEELVCEHAEAKRLAGGWAWLLRVRRAA